MVSPPLRAAWPVNNAVEAKAGDMVYNTAGETVELEAGVEVIDAEGNAVEYSGTGTVKMLQLVVTYKLKATPGAMAPRARSRTWSWACKFDCDPESGATTFITCDAILDKNFATDAARSDGDLRARFPGSDLLRISHGHM